MLKLIGLLLIVVAATGMGFLFAARYVARPAQIRRLIHAMQILESEISYGATPLKETMQIIANRLKDEVGTLFQSAHDKLLADPSRSFQSIWREVVGNQFTQTSLKEAEREVLLQLGEQLGLSHRVDQVKHIQLAMQHLKMSEEEARLEKVKYEKMCRNLGLLAGLLIAILLL